jgi:hypothetical protein
LVARGEKALEELLKKFKSTESTKAKKPQSTEAEKAEKPHKCHDCSFAADTSSNLVLISFFTLPRSLIHPTPPHPTTKRQNVVDDSSERLVDTK